MAGIDWKDSGAVARRCYRPLKLVRVGSVPVCRSHRPRVVVVEEARIVPAPIATPAPVPPRPTVAPVAAVVPGATATPPFRRALMLGVMLAAGWLAGARTH